MPNFKRLFPINFEKNLTPKYLKEFLTILSKKAIDRPPRISNKREISSKTLLKKYSKIPLSCKNPFKKGKEIVNDFFEEIPNWRSPNQNLNIGTPVNILASAVYALSLDTNVLAVNQGLGGKTIIAENAVSQIFGELIDKKRVKGIFTYGGSGTNLYGMKLGIQKALPESNRKGIKGKIKVLIAKDSHYAQVYSADWLGIGTNNVIKIEENKNRRSNIENAEKTLRCLLDKKNRIGAILLNGGTSYFHAIDDIKKFFLLRNKLVKEYKLNYKPHIHVDAVIGWMWLFFKGYNFKKNPLKIKKDTLRKLKKQYKRIAQLKYADSWGADFHKGIGGCPVDSSVFVFNNEEDTILFSKKDNQIPSLFGLHQISERFNTDSPVNYSLENSRSAGPFLSALTSMHTMGMNGFRVYLARLIDNASHIKKLVEKRADLDIKDPYKYAFVVMIRLYPPKYANEKSKKNELNDIKLVNEINKYSKDFFNWDKKTRMSKNKSPEYSYSTFCYELPCGTGIHTLKIYPISPHVNKKDTKRLIKTIIKQKDRFDNLNKI
jgi:L-2,4-diaminobutyrate decarboxylase